MERITLTQSATRPALDFVRPGLLAGTVGMIVGQGAIGKSMLALQIGLATATGRPVVGGSWQPGAPGPVTLIFGKDPPEMLQKLCQRLVVIDPLAFLADPDENDNGGMTHLMRMLRGIAAASGGTIIVLHHVSKGGEGEREEWTAARGASALTTACRWQTHLRPPTKAEMQQLDLSPELRSLWIRCALVKANYGHHPEQWFRRGNGGVLEPGQFATSAITRGKKGGRRDQA